MKDSEKIEHLTALIKYLCVNYLKWDISWSRTAIKNRVREVEQTTGIQFIPSEDEMKKPLPKGFCRSLYDTQCGEFTPKEKEE